MVDLCTNSYYVEFFWFPNRGTEDGYWENCWTNDGLEEESIDINDSLEDEYQVATTYMFEVIMKILQPMTLLTKEEYYDEKTNLRECLRHLFTKVKATLLLIVNILLSLSCSSRLLVWQGLMPFQLLNTMQPLLWLRPFTLEEDFITLQ